MQRRTFLQNSGAACAGLLSGRLAAANPARTKQPNVLWILGEDLCPDLGCYGDPWAHTPNLDRLASQGARFTGAFSTAPVCSAARSALGTGMYQTSIGAHNHRSHREDGYTLPKGVRFVTEHFRDAGYYTANVDAIAPGVKGSCKTDMNFEVENPFDGTDWNQRRPGQPFYAQVNFKEAHRTFRKAETNPVDPDRVVLPPYYPDHPIARRDWALYLDTIGRLDRKVGAVLRRLDEEGLADNTLVFFFGDHGRCHVRGKQWLYDGGIHVPLIVRWPGHLRAGTVREELVSSIDITATSLQAAGIPVPAKMEGRPFLGPEPKSREFIIAARDRCDETVDRIRCVRTKEFKYIRNFYPERAYTQLNRYKECSYPVLRLMRRLYAEGKLTPEQARFMAATRPPEELYDLRADPHEVYNLAEDPRHVKTLESLRSTLQRWIRESGDQGAIPEAPSIPRKFEEKMKEIYDKRLRTLYAAEGMSL